MKASIRKLIGKTISGVIVKQGGPVRHQVFVLFTDDTYFEFYSCDRMSYSGEIASGTAADVRAYMGDVQKIVIDDVAEDGEERRDAA